MYLKYNYIVTVSNKLREIFNSSYNLDDKTKVVCDVINHELVINLSNQSIIRHHNKKLIITINIVYTCFITLVLAKNLPKNNFSINNTIIYNIFYFTKISKKILFSHI